MKSSVDESTEKVKVTYEGINLRTHSMIDHRPQEVTSVGV